jgi:hypothetical protein
MESIELNSVVLPADAAIKRQLRRPIPEGKKALYKNGQLGTYDSHTLLYDVFLNTDNKTISAIGPPLLNLEQELLPANIEVNGHSLPLTLRTNHKKLIILEAISPAPLSSDTTAIIHLSNGQHQTITLSTSALPDGLSLVTVQKNNKLQWIMDWIRYYKNEFGIQHVYIYDNNSESQDALFESLKGLATIIPWNFPHGTSYRSGNKFCQVGALNHFKYRLGKNTNIFNFDIDELLVCRSQKIKHSLCNGKITRFNSYTVPFTATPDMEYSFRDFRFREKEPRDRSTKYVVNGSLPGMMNVHHFNPTPRFWHKLLPKSWKLPSIAPLADAYFLHYRGITTNWKIHHNIDRLEATDLSENLYVEDTAVIDIFSRIDP